MLEILNNISLKPYNTFGIDVNAEQFCSITSNDDLVTVLKQNRKPLFILSGGSNMLLTKNIEALVVHINTKGISVVKEKEYALVTAKAGENWHDFVQYCISENFGGIENLSLIPGCVGSSPIQNIGAYGVEIKDTFVSCRALHRNTLKYKEFSNEACNFGYRDSIFKTSVKDEYIITEVTFKLTTKNHNLKTAYGAIKQELESRNINKITIKNIADAVINIRKSKLPNPSEIGNSGSFFKNPVISKVEFEQLQKKFPVMPFYSVSEALVKIPAGWLIDQANFKGYSYKNAGVHQNQALVLINKTGKATGQEVLELSTLIKQKIKTLFNIELEVEVNIF